MCEGFVMESLPAAELEVNVDEDEMVAMLDAKLVEDSVELELVAILEVD